MEQTSQGFSDTLLRKKDLKALHPRKDYHIDGEILPTHKETRAQDLRALPLCKYRSHNRVVYGVKGYLPSGNGKSYAAILCNRLPLRAGIAAICILLVAAVAFFLPSSPIPTALGLDPNATDYSDSNEFNQGGTAGENIEIPGYKTIPIAADSTEVTVDFRNPEANNCYFVIHLSLEDGTELYRSELIPPGKGIQHISLSQPLAAGEYAAAIRYDTYAMDGQTPLNGAEIKVTLLAQGTE